MFRRFIRWIPPLVVLALIGMYFVLSPMLANHAALPATAPHITVPYVPALDFFYHF